MRIHAILHKGRVVEMKENDLIPGSEAWPVRTPPDFGCGPLVRFEIPMISYYDPVDPQGPPRRRWWGGHMRHGWTRETDPCEIHLTSRSRAERWLRRAGQGKVEHPAMVSVVQYRAMPGRGGSDLPGRD